MKCGAADLQISWHHPRRRRQASRLGMCVTARSLGAEGDLIRNITLFAILIYELVGPLLTKIAPAGRRRDPPDGRSRPQPPSVQSEKAKAEKEINNHSYL